MHINLERPDQPEALRLIDELDAYQKPMYPAESHHGIDIDALMQLNVLFALVREEGGEAIGCGAVVVEAEYGELKRMFLRHAHRGKGIGQALLAFLEAEGRLRGARRFVLETGIHQHEALKLYEQAGYVRCGPFGDYVHDPYSVFMRKEMSD